MVAGSVDFSLKTDKVQLLEFFIDGVLEPLDLRGLVLPKVDSSKPLIISGRGPQWLYAYLAHHYHFSRVLATYEPRAGVGVVVYSVNDKEVGLGINLENGMFQEISLGASGRIDIGLIKLGSLQLLRAELVEGAFAEPSELRRLDWRSLQKALDSSKPIIAYVMAPVWISAKISIEFSNLAPWIAVYDPKLENSIVVARHDPKAPNIGQQVEVKIHYKRCKTIRTSK